MAFKMKGIGSLVGPRTESIKQQKSNLLDKNPIVERAGAKNMSNVLAGKDPAQGPRMYDEGPMMYDKEGPKKMDPMHNGEPGVQKEDFKQFSSSKGPLATKEERKAKRKARRKEKGGSRVGNAIRKVKKTVDKVKTTVDKVKNSKVGKVAVGTYKTIKAVKRGDIKSAIKSGSEVVNEISNKKTNKSKGTKMHKKAHVSTFLKDAKGDTKKATELAISAVNNDFNKMSSDRKKEIKNKKTKAEQIKTLKNLKTGGPTMHTKGADGKRKPHLKGKAKEKAIKESGIDLGPKMHKGKPHTKVEEAKIPKKTKLMELKKEGPSKPGRFERKARQKRIKPVDKNQKILQKQEILREINKKPLKY